MNHKTSYLSHVICSQHKIQVVVKIIDIKCTELRTHLNTLHSCCYVQGDTGHLTVMAEALICASKGMSSPGPFVETMLY
jgi:hypothetical protein